MKREAKVIYSMLPSRLKEYPSGSTKLTIFGGHPKPSSSWINRGKAASELAVLKASRIISFTLIARSITLPLNGVWIVSGDGAIKFLAERRVPES